MQDADRKSQEPQPHPGRRELLSQAIAAATALAVGGLLPSRTADAAPQTPKTETYSPVFRPPQLDRRPAEKKLHAVVQLKDGEFNIPGVQKGVSLRYFDGYDPKNGKTGVRPPKTLGPGPTLRARIGDKVEITFLNTVDISKFGESIDKAETGGCDVVAAVYPKNDTSPNCFHGSSTGNLHFHGTHVTPNGLGDNVLVQVIPDNKPQDWTALFTEVFAKAPTQFSQMPAKWWERQSALVKAFDDAARKKNPSVTPLLPIDKAQIAQNLWPEYLIGAYPNCFTIPDWAAPPPGGQPKYAMGQAPGTHWYHAHKHGSTSLHLFNGLAGAFIIEGKYDDDLRKIYGERFVENVLVCQQIREEQNLMMGTGTGSGLNFVNGQLAPTIAMRPGEIQLWRIVNATVSHTLSADLTAPAGFAIMQIAQDGVQFKWENVDPASSNPKPILQLAPGNRVDVLVQASTVKNTYNFGAQPLVKVKVDGDAPSEKMSFPNAGNFPEFPEFLKKDIPDGNLRQRVMSFGWEKGRTAAGLTNGLAPRFTIDGVQFSENRIDQYLTLGTEEEWTLYNYTSIAHPFHIHVNPFQVTEIFTPPNARAKTAASTYAPKDNFAWQDVVGIPPAETDVNGKLILNDKGFATNPGRVVIRQRYADFAGTFVLHCHILAHEDRGMMQLVQIVDPKSIMVHHH